MIHVRRSHVPRPKWFGSTAWGKTYNDLMRHIRTQAGTRSQRRLSAVTGAWPKDVESAIWGLFDARCAICESALRYQSGASVKRFRPVQVEESRDRYAFSYAALLWENLLLLCHDCDRARGDIFPVRSPSPLRQVEFKSTSAATVRKAYARLEKNLAEAQRSERPLQIDPTLDEPAEFLLFDADGVVQPTRHESRSEIARHTIEVFQLNRSDLVQRRLGACKDFARVLVQVRIGRTSRNPDSAVAQLDKWHDRLAPALELLRGEFQAAKISVFARWLKARLLVPLEEILPRLQWPTATLDHAHRVLLPVWKALTGEKPKTTRKAKPKPAPSKRDTPAPTSAPPSTAAADAKDVAPAPVLHFSRQRIAKVRLKNFRLFADATFEIPATQPDDAFGPGRELRRMIREAGMPTEERLSEPERYCGWKMLLGENGVGKSSVLQAIALALIADTHGRAALDDYPPLRESLPTGATEGIIEVWLEEPARKLRLRFTEERVTFTKQPATAETTTSVLFLRGYGATRLLPAKKKSREEPSPAPPENPAPTPALPAFKPQDALNLFNPYHSLTDAEAWLHRLDPESRYLAFITLKELLDLPADANLDFRDWNERLTFGLVQGNRFTPLEHFSAGYQSAVALGCDIMAGFGDTVGDMRKRAGIVLLDEIGANLHPRWRLRIVQALRRAFPELQFIASTHEPLCLRGLGLNEAALLTLEEELATPAAPAAAARAPNTPKKYSVRLRDDLPSPAIYRVDQLLTGDFFNLKTAYDPDEETAFDAYHALLVEQRVRGSLSQQRAKLLAFLQERLRNRLVLGDTVAERRVLAALEEAEIENKESRPRERPKGSPEARRAAQRLLQRITPPV